MGKKVCSTCGEIYWINLFIDSEYACPKCGYVEADRIVGQLSGKQNITDE